MSRSELGSSLELIDLNWKAHRLWLADQDIVEDRDSTLRETIQQLQTNARAFDRCRVLRSRCDESQCIGCEVRINYSSASSSCFKCIGLGIKMSSMTASACRISQSHSITAANKKSASVFQSPLSESPVTRIRHLQHPHCEELPHHSVKSRAP